MWPDPEATSATPETQSNKGPINKHTRKKINQPQNTFSKKTYIVEHITRRAQSE